MLTKNRSRGKNNRSIKARPKPESLMKYCIHSGHDRRKERNESLLGFVVGSGGNGSSSRAKSAVFAVEMSSLDDFKGNPGGESDRDARRVVAKAYE